MRSTVQAIAQRRLELSHPDGTTSEVLVLIGQPRTDKQGMCACEYSIEGLAEFVQLTQSGLDAIHALERTLIEIGRHLAETPEVDEGRLKWRDGNRDELGFPTGEGKSRV